jgi:hypothetical protein
MIARMHRDYIRAAWTERPAMESVGAG